MIITDTSVWIDALNGNNSKQVEWFSELIQQDQEIAITPTILQEILQGVKLDADFEKLQLRLGGFKLLTLPSEETAIEAAKLYRRLRRNGITIRKSNDCLIAVYALHFEAVMLHNDRDFDIIAQHFPLKIFNG